MALVLHAGPLEGSFLSTSFQSLSSDSTGPKSSRFSLCSSPSTLLTLFLDLEADALKLLATQQAWLPIWVDFLLTFASKAWSSKTDPCHICFEFSMTFASKAWSFKTDLYSICLEFTAIFLILRVGKDRHLGVVLIKGIICISLALHTYNECMRYEYNTYT